MPLTTTEVYALARNAGLEHDAAVLATAYAQVESGYDPSVIGDKHLQTATEGPSVGLWQIRLLSDGGTTRGGRTREQLLQPGENAAAMVEISGGGVNWVPWIGSATKASIALPAVRAEIEEANEDDPGFMEGALKNALAFTIGGPVGAAANIITGGKLGGGLLDTANMLRKLGELTVKAALWVNDPRNWPRVLEVVGGAAITGIGLTRLVKGF